MEGSQRNLMILYAIVCFLAVVGVTLNFFQIFNLASLENTKITSEVREILNKGFYSIAFLYLSIALTSAGVLIKKKYSMTLLIILGLLLLTTFVFGPFVFDVILGDSAIDVNVSN